MHCYHIHNYNIHSFPEELAFLSQMPLYDGGFVVGSRFTEYKASTLEFRNKRARCPYFPLIQEELKMHHQTVYYMFP